MKKITILRGSKQPVKYEIIDTEKYVIVKKKQDKRLLGELQRLSDDGESLVYTDNSKVKGYKRSKQKKKRIKKRPMRK